eukprot:m.173503 g.173503  ORF g.173503 m.173503 type:complete len:234 (-) comp53271_c0_seq7:100-801(-)
MAHVQLLIDAVRDDNLPSCERIVQKCGKDLIVTPQPRENGLTALHVAARCNHVLILKWFLLQGINTNIQDSDGWTAMMWAAAIGSADCLRELLAYEADRRIQSRDGVTAQDYARRHKQVDSSAAFLEREEFLAKLGSRTKPALREAVRSIGQAHAEESQPIQVIILDQGQGAVEDNTAQPTTEEAVSGGAEDAVAQTNACAQDSHADHHGQLQAHHQPVPVLDLGNLDFELPD